MTGWLLNKIHYGLMHTLKSTFISPQSNVTVPFLLTIKVIFSANCGFARFYFYPQCIIGFFIVYKHPTVGRFY